MLSYVLNKLHLNLKTILDQTNQKKKKLSKEYNSFIHQKYYSFHETFYINLKQKRSSNEMNQF